MKVYLLSRPHIDWDALEQFEEDEGLGEIDFDSMSDAETLVEIAGRLCYMSFHNPSGRSNAAFNKNLIKQKHFSVLEHANWTVLITGVSRSLTHELVRHRHFSFSQLSQRYVDHTNMPVVVPPGLPAHLTRDWVVLMSHIKEFYEKTNVKPSEAKAMGTQALKRLRTTARSVLPNAMTTKIVVTGNARAWREFIEKRARTVADPEIHQLAVMICRKLAAAAPSLFEDTLGGIECEST